MRSETVLFSLSFWILSLLPPISLLKNQLLGKTLCLFPAPFLICDMDPLFSLSTFSQLLSLFGSLSQPWCPPIHFVSLPKLQSSDRIELWLNGHRPGSSTVLEAAHFKSAWVICLSRCKVPGDNYPGNMRKSFYTPCHPGIDHFRALYSFASSKICLLWYQDDIRFHKLHNMLTMLIIISMKVHVTVNKDLVSLSNKPSTSVPDRRDLFPHLSHKADRAQQGQQFQGKTQRHYFY